MEWATRYRPVHIHSLLLGGVAPREDAEFLYTPDEAFVGEGATLLRAAAISLDGKSVEEAHSEFQAAGLFLAHILECPLEPGNDSGPDASGLLRKHLPLVASRIRRSLKPKRVMLVTEMPPEVVQNILALDLGCEVILNDGRPFALAPSVNEAEIARFRAVLDSRAIR